MVAPDGWDSSGIPVSPRELGCRRRSPYRPLQDPEGAQTSRVEQRLGLAHPAAGGQGGQVGGRRTAVGPGPPALAHQLVDAVGPEELGLGAVQVGGADGGQLVHADLHRDVLTAQLAQRMAAAAVADVGPQPLVRRIGESNRGVRFGNNLLGYPVAGIGRVTNYSSVMRTPRQTARTPIP